MKNYPACKELFITMIILFQVFRRIQQQAAFIEFSLQNFDEARELFKSGQVDIREVLCSISVFDLL